MLTAPISEVVPDVLLYACMHMVLVPRYFSYSRADLACLHPLRVYCNMDVSLEQATGDSTSAAKGSASVREARGT